MKYFIAILVLLISNNFSISNNSIYVNNNCSLGLELYMDGIKGQSYIKLWLSNRDIDNNRIYYQNDRKLLIGELKDCRGELNFTYIDSISKIIIKGQYINGLDTLVRQTYSSNPITIKDTIILQRYFQPIKTGDWQYLDFKKKLICIRKYNNGVLIW